MTNKKEIIINGIDVSECIFHSLTTMGHAGYNYCKCFECACEYHNDCYYKQLKRKEQECNKLYIQLKTDEEYYKEEENTLRKIIKNKEERNIELYKENNKLKQTLTEIKERCNSVENIENINSLYDAKLSGMYLQARKILQKISEVLKND